MTNIKILFLFLIFFVSPIRAIAVSTEPHLQYFGYLQAQGTPAGAENYFDDIGNLNNSNVVQVYAELYPPTMNAYLDDVQANHMKAILMLNWVFVENITVVNGKNQATLFPNWRERWNTLKNIIEPRQQDILAFYFDEPMYIGINEQDFRSITQTIQQDFPTAKILAIEAYTQLAQSFVSPSYIEYITDYGFDYYYTITNETWSNYLPVYTQLKEVAPDKDLWVIADGYMNTTDQQTKLELITAFETYFALANNDQQYIGMLNFLYSPIHTSDIQYSLKDIFNISSPAYSKQLFDEHIDVGSSIIAQQPITQPTISQIPGDTNGDNRVNGQDYITWLIHYRQVTTNGNRDGDFNIDGRVNGQDYVIWLNNYGKL